MNTSAVITLLSNYRGSWGICELLRAIRHLTTLFSEMNDQNNLVACAVGEWEKAQILFNSPAWNGQPVARHLAETLMSVPQLENDLVGLLVHQNPLVVAYSLLVLDTMNSSSIKNLRPEVVQSHGKLTRRTGSFSEKMELGAFARSIQKQWLARNEL